MRAKDGLRFPLRAAYHEGRNKLQGRFTSTREGNMVVRTSVDLKLDRSSAFEGFVEELSRVCNRLISMEYGLPIVNS